MLKAKSAASDNFGNFFAQNTFIAASGVLMITGTMKSLGYEITEIAVVQASFPIAIIALILAALNNLVTDRQMARKYGKKGGRK